MINEPLLDPPVKRAFHNVDSILYVRVLDFCKPNEGWNLDLIRRYLHPNIINHIALVQPPNTQSTEDTLIWRSSSNGNFSIKSAYIAIENQKAQEHNNLWSKIWKWPTY